MLQQILATLFTMHSMNFFATVLGLGLIHVMTVVGLFIIPGQRPEFLWLGRTCAPIYGTAKMLEQPKNFSWTSGIGQWKKPGKMSTPKADDTCHGFFL